MSSKLEKVIHQIQLEKRRLAALYESKGLTDFEVLRLGNKIDRLINEHTKLIKSIF